MNDAIGTYLDGIETLSRRIQRVAAESMVGTGPDVAERVYRLMNEIVGHEHALSKHALAHGYGARDHRRWIASFAELRCSRSILARWHHDVDVSEVVR